VNRDFLGDSYDAVKRLWQEACADWAPLYAEPRFIPGEDLQRDYTRLTRIPMLTGAHMRPYSMLNDPDIGIRLPNEENQGESVKHTKLATVIAQLRDPDVQCVITFDQSHYRRHTDRTRERQRHRKMAHLTNARLFAFYYASHAPFLFTFRDAATRQKLLARLIALGFPDDWFEIGNAAI
jgi:hypothetical protein